jgi:rhamnulokinase
VGVELDKVIINDESFEYSFTNEGGVENTIRLLKNVMGLWLVQQCRDRWQKDGTRFSYDELSSMAEVSSPFAAYIDPDRTEFLSPGDMPGKINNYLLKTGQKTINDKGQMIRVILESLSFKYRWVVEKIEDITGKSIDCLHIVGGGVRNELLCEFTADVTGKRVIAGPIEATAIGNILMQVIATGQLKTLAEARELVRKSFQLKEYQPEETSSWQEKYERFEITTGL